LLKWFAYSLAIAITAYILPGIMVESVAAVLVTALVLGLINAVFRPILVILTLPVTILTLGLFMFVINAALILLTAAIVPGFEVAGFWWAVLFSVIVSIINSILNRFIISEIKQ
jgi:putative membrane protein